MKDYICPDDCNENCSQHCEQMKEKIEFGTCRICKLPGQLVGSGVCKKCDGDKAFVCSCGSVRFSLLENKYIECNRCQKQFGHWEKEWPNGPMLHVDSDKCWCSPSIEYIGGNKLIIHNDVN